MDDNDRRRFNRDENDYYTNNSRRIPTPPRSYGAPSQGMRRDYGVPRDGGQSSFPQRPSSSVPQGSQPAQRPYDRPVSQQVVHGGYGQYGNAPRAPYSQPSPYGSYGQPQAPSYPQGGYQQQGGYPPVNGASQGYQGMPQQGGFVPPQPQYVQNYDERDISYENVQAQPAEKKKRGLFGFGKQKKEEFDPANMGNVIITEPRTYDDVRVIIDGLRKRQAIIIDLSKVSDKDSQRILDFLSGAIYALGGAQQRINDHMFLFTPEGVMIQGPASLRNKYR